MEKNIFYKIDIILEKLIFENKDYKDNEFFK